MRNLLILILGAVIVWLLIERTRLIDEANVAKADLDKAQKTVEVYVRQVGVLTTPVPGGPLVPAKKDSWLNAHLEKGAKALTNPQSERIPR